MINDQASDLANKSQEKSGLNPKSGERALLPMIQKSATKSNDETSSESLPVPQAASATKTV